MPAPPLTKDQRAIHRVPCRLAVSSGERSAEIGVAVDISLDGLFVLTEKPLPKGTLLPLVLPLPDGEITDFRRAVKAEKGEEVVFSWIEWPCKEARDEAWPKIMEDERMKAGHQSMPFDGKRMIYGGFAPIVEA